MATRTVHLVLFRQSPAQRTHFAVFIPSAANTGIGTLIHVVGAPMIGYSLKFKRNYDPAGTRQLHTIMPIGQINSQRVTDSTTTEESIDSTPRGHVEIIAASVAPPGVSQNFMAPVNDTTNRRCQEWTMEFVRELVRFNYMEPEAIQAVNSKRDPPGHGIGLQSAVRDRGRGT